MAAIKIQKIIRGKFGRMKSRLQQSNIAAERIQAMWRGVVARVRSDKMWLNRTVIPIQCAFRKIIAKRIVKSGRKELDTAALSIQQTFRAWKARLRQGQFYLDRELDYREDVIASLTAEEEYVSEQLAKLGTRVAKGSIKQELDTAVRLLYRKYDEIYDLENNLIETRRQREILSPRAIQQGWVKELDEGAVNYREQITKSKLSCLFDQSYRVAVLEKEFERLVEEVVSTADNKAKLIIFKDQEYSDRRERYYEKELKELRKAKRLAVADEKRKWKLHFYTKEGKPDKKRRPGKPWDPSVIAKDDKMTYTGAGVDLLAFNKDFTGMKQGSDESIKNVMNQMSLQTYLDQVNHYEQLLNPISEIMQLNLGAPPNAKIQPEDLGFGEMGKDLPKALNDIGATPKFWNHSNSDTTKKDTLSKISKTKLSSIPTKFNLPSSNQSTSSSLTSNFDERKLVIRKPSSSAFSLGSALPSKPSSPNRPLPALKNVNLRRKMRIKERSKSRAVIPWALLDELDGEKKRFENEKSYIEFNHKY